MRSFFHGILKFILYAAIGVVICVGGIAYFFMTWEPDRGTYPLRGIDVSHHQGEIDWSRVAGDDVAFAYMKASEGADFRDKSFAQNWAAAGKAGIARGAYHFFSFCSSGFDQAKNFLGVLPIGAKMLPPVLDLEFNGTCARRPASEEVLKEISSFVTTVEQALGREVVLYVPEDFYSKYIEGKGLNRKVWVRSMWRSPDYVREWMFWQYHQQGAVKGIEGAVDLNVMGAGQKISDLLN